MSKKTFRGKFFLHNMLNFTKKCAKLNFVVFQAILKPLLDMISRFQLNVFSFLCICKIFYEVDVLASILATIFYVNQICKHIRLLRLVY